MGKRTVSRESAGMDAGANGRGERPQPGAALGMRLIYASRRFFRGGAAERSEAERSEPFCERSDGRHDAAAAREGGVSAVERSERSAR